MHKVKFNKKLLAILGILLVVFVLGKIILAAFKYSPFLLQLIFTRTIDLKKSDGNINILLLGIGGGNHDGANLSDTMIFASINQTKNKITLISVPRDLWVPDLNQKINAAYAIGEAKRKGGGLVLAEAVVSKIVGQPIDYGLRVDFAGFVKAVDMVGGLDINVDNNFDDYIYPVDGQENASCGKSDNDIATYTATVSAEQDLALFFPCRYKHVHFEKGMVHMNGEQALEFVRSRHAVGDEGTDFARSARQQKIIKSFKDKVFSIGTLFNPIKILGLYDILQNSIDTDIKQTEFDDFIRLAQKLKTANIVNNVIDYGDPQATRSGLLINPPTSQDYDFSWVLIPRIGNGDFSEIKKYVDCQIKIGNCKITPTSITQ